MKCKNIELTLSAMENKHTATFQRELLGSFLK
jgi:hypothetical protein